MSKQDTAATELDPKLTHFIAIGNGHGWGRAKTEKQAIANMTMNSLQGLKPSRFAVYRCTAETYVNDMGGLSRPGSDPEAVQIRKHGY